jgi:hypothetical protein
LARRLAGEDSEENNFFWLLPAIDPRRNNIWRARWNNGNQPHSKVTWTVDWALEAQIDR